MIRIAVPAMVYIAVEESDKSEDELKAHAYETLNQACGGDGFLLDGFERDQLVIVYLDPEAPVTIEDRDW